MTQKRKTKKKTRIPKNDYDQLNFFYKLYYDFMCFFNEAYCPDYPKYWPSATVPIQINGIAEQTRVNNQLNRPTNGNNNYIEYTFNRREVTPINATRRQKRVNNPVFDSYFI